MFSSRSLLPAICLLATAACGSGGADLIQTADGVDSVARTPETVPEDAPSLADTAPDLPFLPEAVEATAPETLQPECDPGEGCFLDSCTENGDCDSGWCVEHMGETVCSQACTEECPPGWKCQQVTGAGPDLVFVCVSVHSNLCKPCAEGSDCVGVSGAQDVCVSYGAEGSFCGGACDDALGEGKKCPWGFSCSEVETVDGIATTQCVADAGVCPCTKKSAELALWTPCSQENEWGTCAGMRVCTEEGLSDCDALVAAPETCNGEDDDCDEDVDEPLKVEGSYVNLCEDGNDCTADKCTGEAGCEYDLLDEGECIDGDACTVGDHCELGECIGLPIVCDDGNLCTEDLCDGLGGCASEFNSAVCDDSDPCTVNDLCGDGQCAGFAVDCDCQTDEDCIDLEDSDACNGTHFCDTAKLPYLCAVDPKTVVECPEPEGMDAICRKHVCDADTGECSLLPDHEGYACDDGNKCTVGDQCEEGECMPGVPPACNDGNVCTDDSCEPDSGCVFPTNTIPCDDGNTCTTGDSCDGGECLPGEPAVCDDDNVCTDDSCAPGAGCIYLPNEGVCDDANACTLGDHCSSGLCQFTGFEECDDSNGCTDEFCDPATGCNITLNDGPCDDGSACTVGDKCAGGVCLSGPLAQCDDGNACTDDSCDQETGCRQEPNESQCDDGNECTLGDHCVAGLCQFTGFEVCDDSNVCTDDVCDPAVGCQFTLNEAPCDDSDLCTTGDHCHLGACISANTLECDDGNPCTADSCGEGVGCEHEPAAGECDDQNACTEGDSCVGGVCLGGSMLDCSDGNVCTDDLCDLTDGCVFNTNTIPCNDGNLCTTDDVCAGGECVGSGELNCDDGNDCTADSCAEGAGCKHEPADGECEDGNACTVDDFCNDGNCLPGGDLVCDDGKFCNGVESCEPVTGCIAGDPPDLGDGVTCTVDTCDDDSDQIIHAPADALCDDQLFCNGPEWCHAEDGCLPGPEPVLDDGVGCTVDSCDDDADTVVHEPDDNACNDNVECTADWCDPVDDCQHSFEQGCGYFDVVGGKIHLANNNYIKCFGGLTVTASSVSCEKPLFNQEQYSLTADQNTMLGLHNEGEDYAAGHTYIKEQIGTFVGYSASRTVKMNEGGLDNMWSGTGTYDNEHCYHEGQVLNWKANASCHNGMGGGSNVLSSFILYK